MTPLPTQPRRAIRDWPLWGQYALALGAVVAALGVRLLMRAVVGDRMPFAILAVLLPLVLLVRPVPFLAAAALALVGTWYLFIPPAFSFSIAGPDTEVEIALFSLAALLAAATAWLSQRADSRRQLADKGLRESEARFRGLVSILTDLVWITDARGELLGPQPTFEKYTGSTPEQNRDGGWANTLHPDDRDRVAELWRIATETRSRYESRGRIWHAASQGYRYYVGRALPLLNADGTIWEWVGSLTDVHDQVAAQEAVRDSEARYRALFEVAVYGVITIDERGLVESANPAAERLFGYAAAEMIGGNVSMLMPEPYRCEHDSYLDNYARTGERKIIGIGREVVGRRKDGSTFPMDLAVGEFRLDGKRHFQGLVHDITVRKQLEVEQARHTQELAEALARRTAQVQQAERALASRERMAAVGTLASGLAHDMKNILLPLSMRMDCVLAASGLAGEARTDLAVVVALIDHLRSMARNLELFSRDPAQEGTEGITELSGWLTRVESLIESSLDFGWHREERRVGFKAEIPAGLPAIAVAPHRLTQAVLNLILNARDAVHVAREAGQYGPTGTGGCITLRARAGENRTTVELGVTDDGCGMDAETARHAAEPFFTTKDRSGVPGVSGSGLGLALAHAIVQRIGGSLAIDSAPGKGTTIAMTFPAVAAAGDVGTADSAVEPKGAVDAGSVP